MPVLLLSPLLCGLLLLAMAAPAHAGFGLPEVDGLLRVRDVSTVGLGTLRGSLTSSYYYQDAGLDSRYHRFLGRLGLTFGLGEVGHLSFDSRFHGVMRFASEDDVLLYAGIGESDWQAGLGDSDLGIKLAMPLPFSRFRFAGEAIMRLPTGDSEKAFTVVERDYEFMGILSIDILRGTSFVPTRLHLNAGHRLNNNVDGYGTEPSVDPSQWSSPFPPFYPALEDDELIESRRQNLFGVGLEFIGNRTAIYGELTHETFYHLTNTFATRENLLQLALGFSTRGPWQMQLFGSFDINLSKDDFDTEFTPHYPGIISTFGVSRNFQVLAGDPDHDGIRGDSDLCPDRAEDYDGFEDGDGCPDPDNDRDGVPDVIDLAPSLPEDFDGFEDDDGRPDLDNDNDGIGDRQDLCPDRPEDFDGFEDGDGCPDRDSLQPQDSEAEPAPDDESDEDSAP